MEKKVLKTLEEHGPLTGGELMELSGIEGFSLWRTCLLSGRLSRRSIATRYLRLDKRLEGLARISPSIYREFLTYTVLAPEGREEELDVRSAALRLRIETISKAKVELAYEVMASIAAKADMPLPVSKAFCVLIAGDIVHCMAHDVPRPERSTGRLVNGSDIDIVIVADEGVPADALTRLDELIYQEKYRLLITPHIREEIDYVVKDLNKVKEQMRFDTFNCMLACKIMQEATLLFGSESIFNTVKVMLREQGITAKLQAMERLAKDQRKETEERLLSMVEPLAPKDRNLFYPSEESEEFE